MFYDKTCPEIPPEWLEFGSFCPVPLVANCCTWFKCLDGLPLSIAGSQKLFEGDTRSTKSKLGGGGREGCSQDIKSTEASSLIVIANYGLGEEGLAC